MDRFSFVISVIFGMVLAALFVLSFAIPFIAVPILLAFLLVPIVYFGLIRKPHSSSRTP